MKKFKPVIFASSILSAGFTSVGVLAESKWGLGIGTAIQNQVYASVDAEVNVLPLIYYQSEKLHLVGPQFGYEILEWGDVEFTFLGRYRFDGYDAEDEPLFEGMEDRSGSLDLGLEIQYETDYGDLSFSYMKDAMHNHKGSELSVGYSLPFIMSSGVIVPYVQITQQSDDLVDYYFGVRADEVTVNRSFFEGESTTNLELGVKVMWQFGEHHSVIANLGFTSLGSEIKDSPLVDGSTATNLILGYVYVF